VSPFVGDYRLDVIVKGVLEKGSFPHQL